MNEELKTLFEGSELSEEFVGKVAAIMEAAVEEQTGQIEEQTKAKYEKLSEEYAAYVVSEMEDKTAQYIESEVLPMVEKYLDYSVAEFMTENKLVIESGVKVELAESFLSGVAGIAESYNVVVPVGQDDIVAEMQAKVESLQQRFDRVLDEKAELQAEITESVMAGIVDAQVADLTESQKEKFFKAAVKVTYQDDEQYKASISDLFESYFPAEPAPKLDEQTEPKKMDESEEPAENQWLSRLMTQV